LKIEVIKIPLWRFPLEWFKNGHAYVGYATGDYAFVYEFTFFGLFKKFFAAWRDRVVNHEYGHLMINEFGYVKYKIPDGKPGTFVLWHCDHKAYDRYTNHGLTQQEFKFYEFAEIKWSYKKL